MLGEAWSSGRRLLLMGSSAYKAKELPDGVRELIDEAMEREATMIVGEAHGASRRFQDYLSSRGYENVVVGHARRIRYNAGDWRTFKYGDDLKERERGMIGDCDSAIVIWVNSSGVIAQNLELLKRLGKPTYVCECSTGGGGARFGMIDSSRSYGRPFQRFHARAGADTGRLSEIVDAFLASDEEELLVECENPSLTGYYLNKIIIDRNLRSILEVAIESGSCYLKRIAQ
ncbi:MAG: hypothetical protein OEW93_08845 [Candidatus Bathyarchaeota archaeon]|nr:hypothetical protein [Candidatus Bathyarchaeota archaeon]